MTVLSEQQTPISYKAAAAAVLKAFLLPQQLHSASPVSPTITTLICEISYSDPRCSIDCQHDGGADPGDAKIEWARLC